MKVFISQPMRGLTEEEILKIRNRLYSDFCALYQGEIHELIDNYNHDLPSDANPLLYLGEDIIRMAEADVVIFAPGWEKARGCNVEHEVAEQYGLEVIEYVKRRNVDSCY